MGVPVSESRTHVVQRGFLQGGDFDRPEPRKAGNELQRYMINKAIHLVEQKIVKPATTYLALQAGLEPASWPT